MTHRRRFLTLSAGAALVGPAALARLARAAPPAGDGEPDSALATGKPRPLGYETIDGFLSRTQLSLHHGAHYGGALKSLLAIEAGLERADRAAANANWSDWRALSREQVHAMNSVRLHELYFGGLATVGGDPPAPVAGALKARFGTVERWLDDFAAAAKAARGWALLVWQPVNGRLYDVVVDVHDVGVPVQGVPLVVLDCYEHAFYVDYQNRKGDYVDAFPRFVNWPELGRRFAALR